MRAAAGSSTERLMDGIFTFLTGRPYFQTPMKLKEVPAGQEVMDTPLGRYLITSQGPKLLMMEPPNEKKRFAIAGYTQDESGKVTQYYAPITQDRFARPTDLGGIQVQGKPVVKDGKWVSKK